MSYYRTNFPQYALEAVSQESQLVALNRAIAGALGMDPRFTISSNIANAISRLTGLDFEFAKLLFHGGVAGFVAVAAGLDGALLAIVVALLWKWLESFDDSAQMR